MSVIDLFCGCGGLSLGFIQNDFNVIASFDNWPAAIECYNKNFDHRANIADLSNVENTVELIRNFNPQIIIGGPPCQEFSHAGKRVEGDKANLTISFARIVEIILPHFFVMENVPRAKNSKAYQKAKRIYKRAGYGLTEVVLDASRCGVPQKRKRFFVIGSLNDNDYFLAGNIFSNCSSDPISVKQFFDNNNYVLEIDAYYRHPTTYSRRAIFSVHEPSPTIRGVNRPMPSTYKFHKNDVRKEHNVRKLTPQERAYIQTFPSCFRFEENGISYADIEQLIGNAVPVMLANKIAMSLKSYIEGNIMRNKSLFVQWLREKRQYSDRTISNVFSRIRRAQKFLPNREIDKYMVTDLESIPEYMELSSDIRSQIKKAIRLWLDFEDSSKD